MLAVIMSKLELEKTSGKQGEVCGFCKDRQYVVLENEHNKKREWRIKCLNFDCAELVNYIKASK
jgi:hypothetical protein